MRSNGMARSHIERRALGFHSNRHMGVLQVRAQLKVGRSMRQFYHKHRAILCLNRFQGDRFDRIEADHGPFVRSPATRLILTPVWLLHTRSRALRRETSPDTEKS